MSARRRRAMKKPTRGVRQRVALFVLALLLTYVAYLHVTHRIKEPPAPQASFLRGSGRIKTVWGESVVGNYRIGIVSDLDRLSSVDGSKKPAWRSIFKRGTLRWRPKLSKYTLDWDTEDLDLITHLGEAGRGMELSELVTYNGELLAFDDRTGVGFAVDRETLHAYPWTILMEGDGRSDKGQKNEWATVKDGNLIVGSFGKEYTNQDGSIAKKWNMWVSIVSPEGKVTHEDWSDKYDVLRAATGSLFPDGYQIHEALNFDEINRKWVVLPRRVSQTPYDEKEDEMKGSNLVMICDEDITRVERKFAVGPQVALRGWSSFAFMPGTQNDVVIALKTEEQEEKVEGKEATQTTFATVFRVSTGEELMEQTEIPGGVKYEGIEVL